MVVLGMMIMPSEINNKYTNEIFLKDFRLQTSDSGLR